MEWAKYPFKTRQFNIAMCEHLSITEYKLT